MSEAVVLRRVDPGRNMARFYRMDIHADLFGQWCFAREWGRIGQAGQTRQAAYASRSEARAALERQCRVKEKRGYVFVI
jgi:predicted DNA-binding WGR domain protein